jgi:nitrate/TMAO reductase-like tetraheme cytochrome c subunit
VTLVRLRTILASGLRKLLSQCNNPLSAIGLLIVIGSLVMFVVFVAVEILSGGVNPYLNVFGYMILPGVFMTGLAIVPVGVLWKRRALRKLGARPIPRYVQLDLNDPATRGAAMIFLGVTFFVVLPALVVSGYQGYHYTESTAFCAKVCHTVMEPQGTAHEASPHARVTCAECHIGAGAGWFVKSKLSGVRQVFAVWLDTYSRPIPPAITQLRPARDTCEECHWPERFVGSKLKQVAHYSPSEDNARHIVRMLLKVGGVDQATGRIEGIHMHMMFDGKIEFVATDEKLQEVPWVRYVRPDGAESIYRSDGRPHHESPPEGIRRTIDCMDCHNRGAHHFYPPYANVDRQLESGRIASDLPFIKREAVAALSARYADVRAAMARIEQSLRTFYEREHPELARSRAVDVAAAVQQVQDIYRHTFFPVMNVDWSTYPENVGHMYSAGCFRCHDGLHVDEQGRAISSDCTICHTFLNPVASGATQLEEGAFHHSMDLRLHQSLRCNQCHTGGNLLRCRDCHDEMKGLTNWDGVPRFRRMPPLETTPATPAPSGPLSAAP